jgi:hypothetical protein
MRDFGVIFERVSLMCDNTSAISVAKNPVFHKRMRHLEGRHHFLRVHNQCLLIRAHMTRCLIDIGGGYHLKDPNIV